MKTYSTKKILLAFIKVIVIICVAILVFWAWLYAKEYFSYSSYDKEKVLIKNSVFVAYVADSEAERSKGLSGKKFLPSNTSMLFEFDTPGIHGIWMKDMFFPIDVIWLDKNKLIVHTKENIDPETFPRVFYPSKDAFYIIETRAGLIKDKGLKIGDEILFGGSGSDSVATSTK